MEHKEEKEPSKTSEFNFELNNTEEKEVSTTKSSFLNLIKKFVSRPPTSTSITDKSTKKSVTWKPEDTPNTPLYTSTRPGNVKMEYISQSRFHVFSFYNINIS